MELAIDTERKMWGGKFPTDTGFSARIPVHSEADGADVARSVRSLQAEKADVTINAKGRLSRGGDRSAKVPPVDIAFTPLLDAQRSAPGKLALSDDRCGRDVFGPDTYRFC
ncbi:MAG: hypothetical protein ACRETL_03250 [Gammaproteobacteria bacterium]